MFTFGIFIGITNKIQRTRTVKLNANVGVFLFNSVTYELYGNVVDHVRNPGRVNTIRGYLCYNPKNSKALVIVGWNFPYLSIINEDVILNANNFEASI